MATSCLRGSGDWYSAPAAQRPQLCGHRSVGNPPLRPSSLPSLLPSPLLSPLYFLSSSKTWLAGFLSGAGSILAQGHGRAPSLLQALGCWSFVPVRPESSWGWLMAGGLGQGAGGEGPQRPVCWWLGSRGWDGNLQMLDLMLPTAQPIPSMEHSLHDTNI